MGLAVIFVGRFQSNKSHAMARALINEFGDASFVIIHPQFDIEWMNKKVQLVLADINACVYFGVWLVYLFLRSGHCEIPLHLFRSINLV